MIKTLYEIFQHWSVKGSVYLLSDLHLNDDDCLLMDPNWIPPDEQIRIINNKVTRSDTFICLGDVGNAEYASQIKAGHKVLLLGNHDRRKDYKDIFDEIYHYINHMRKNQGVELSLKPVNMKGGGYLNFLDYVKSDAKNNCLAKFIVVDADKARDDPGERKNLKLLIDYCSLQNRKGTIPHFLILDSPDFEYAACLHDPNYKNQDTEIYIRRISTLPSLRFR